MKVMVLLLVSAAALLVNSCPIGNKLGNLRSVIDHARNVSSCPKQDFVEDVKRDHGCKDVFFCKVYDILHSHDCFLKGKNEQKLVRNLKEFNKRTCTNCADLPNNTSAPVQVTITIPKLIEDLITCSRTRILNNNRTQPLNSSQTHEPTVAQ